MQDGAIARLQRDPQGLERQVDPVLARVEIRKRSTRMLEDLQRALDALRVVRLDAGRRRGIDSGKLRVKRGPARARGARLDIAPQPRLRRRQPGEAAGERAEVKQPSVPPASNGTLPRAWIPAATRSASSRNRPAEYASVGSTMSIK